MVLAAVALAIVGLGVGTYAIPVSDIVATLFGTGGERESVTVRDLRAPRMAAALLVGAALAAGGSLMQTLTRNPLGSPDLLGISAGASTGALVSIIVAGQLGAVVGVGALVGGAAAAAVVLALAALTRGTDRMGTVVLVGVAVGLLALAVNTFLISAASSQTALQASVWLTGSLHAVTWAQIGWLAGACALLLPAAAVATRPLRILVLGDDLATSLGARLRSAQLFVLAVSVLLVVVTVSVAGPIPFVALVAPALARRITGTAGSALGASVACGMLLVVAAEIVGTILLSPVTLPVGVVTGAIGGIYLLLLLAAPLWRSRRT
ncbi:MAG: FecCD family ABC transporter permease [Microbacteriaceae bacterium]|uniref:FecCD family ABC transporter permease n=1 Tax=Microbacterium sp. JB110 TaxID=2024477 RepID=UPI00148392C2|nr:iron chelate uptake ABC transporter family permease subunit [Microbacterium sp. JB110]